MADVDAEVAAAAAASTARATAREAAIKREAAARRRLAALACSSRVAIDFVPLGSATKVLTWIGARLWKHEPMPMMAEENIRALPNAWQAIVLSAFGHKCSVLNTLASVVRPSTRCTAAASFAEVLTIEEARVLAAAPAAWITDPHTRECFGLAEHLQPGTQIFYRGAFGINAATHHGVYLGSVLTDGGGGGATSSTAAAADPSALMAVAVARKLWSSDVNSTFTSDACLKMNLAEFMRKNASRLDAARVRAVLDAMRAAEGGVAGGDGCFRSPDGIRRVDLVVEFSADPSKGQLADLRVQISDLHTFIRYAAFFGSGLFKVNHSAAAVGAAAAAATGRVGGGMRFDDVATYATPPRPRRPRRVDPAASAVSSPDDDDDMARRARRNVDAGASSRSPRDDTAVTPTWGAGEERAALSCVDAVLDALLGPESDRHGGAGAGAGGDHRADMLGMLRDYLRMVHQESVLSVVESTSKDVDRAESRRSRNRDRSRASASAAGAGAAAEAPSPPPLGLPPAVRGRRGPPPLPTFDDDDDGTPTLRPTLSLGDGVAFLDGDGDGDGAMWGGMKKTSLSSSRRASLRSLVSVALAGDDADDADDGRGADADALAAAAAAAVAADAESPASHASPVVEARNTQRQVLRAAQGFVVGAEDESGPVEVTLGSQWNLRRVRSLGTRNNAWLMARETRAGDEAPLPPVVVKSVAVEHDAYSLVEPLMMIGMRAAVRGRPLLTATEDSWRPQCVSDVEAIASSHGGDIMHIVMEAMDGDANALMDGFAADVDARALAAERLVAQAAWVYYTLQEAAKLSTNDVLLRNLLFRRHAAPRRYVMRTRDGSVDLEFDCGFEIVAHDFDFDTCVLPQCDPMNGVMATPFDTKSKSTRGTALRTGGRCLDAAVNMGSMFADISLFIPNPLLEMLPTALAERIRARIDRSRHRMTPLDVLRLMTEWEVERRTASPPAWAPPRRAAAAEADATGLAGGDGEGDVAAGTATAAPTRPRRSFGGILASPVTMRAICALGAADYGLRTLNCETVATWIATGVLESCQSATAESIQAQAASTERASPMGRIFGSIPVMFFAAQAGAKRLERLMSWKPASALAVPRGPDSADGGGGGGAGAGGVLAGGAAPLTVATAREALRDKIVCADPQLEELPANVSATASACCGAGVQVRGPPAASALGDDATSPCFVPPDAFFDDSFEGQLSPFAIYNDPFHVFVVDVDGKPPSAVDGHVWLARAKLNRDLWDDFVRRIGRKRCATRSVGVTALLRAAQLQWHGATRTWRKTDATAASAITLLRVDMRTRRVDRFSNQKISALRVVIPQISTWDTPSTDHPTIYDELAELTRDDPSVWRAAFRLDGVAACPWVVTTFGPPPCDLRSTNLIFPEMPPAAKDGGAWPRDVVMGLDTLNMASMLPFRRETLKFDTQLFQMQVPRGLRDGIDALAARLVAGNLGGAFPGSKSLAGIAVSFKDADQASGLVREFMRKRAVFGTFADRGASRRLMAIAHGQERKLGAGTDGTTGGGSKGAAAASKFGGKDYAVPLQDIVSPTLLMVQRWTGPQVVLRGRYFFQRAGDSLVLTVPSGFFRLLVRVRNAKGEVAWEQLRADRDRKARSAASAMFEVLVQNRVDVRFAIDVRTGECRSAAMFVKRSSGRGRPIPISFVPRGWSPARLAEGILTTEPPKPMRRAARRAYDAQRQQLYAVAQESATAWLDYYRKIVCRVSRPVAWRAAAEASAAKETAEAESHERVVDDALQAANAADGGADAAADLSQAMEGSGLSARDAIRGQATDFDEALRAALPDDRDGRFEQLMAEAPRAETLARRGAAAKAFREAMVAAVDSAPARTWASAPAVERSRLQRAMDEAIAQLVLDALPSGGAAWMAVRKVRLRALMFVRRYLAPHRAFVRFTDACEKKKKEAEKGAAAVLCVMFHAFSNLDLPLINFVDTHRGGIETEVQTRLGGDEEEAKASLAKLQSLLSTVAADAGVFSGAGVWSRMAQAILFEVAGLASMVALYLGPDGAPVKAPNASALSTDKRLVAHALFGITAAEIKALSQSPKEETAVVAALRDFLAAHAPKHMKAFSDAAAADAGALAAVEAITVGAEEDAAAQESEEADFLAQFMEDGSDAWDDDDNMVEDEYAEDNDEGDAEEDAEEARARAAGLTVAQLHAKEAAEDAEDEEAKRVYDDADAADPSSSEDGESSEEESSEEEEEEEDDWGGGSDDDDGADDVSESESGSSSSDDGGGERRRREKKKAQGRGRGRR